MSVSGPDLQRTDRLLSAVVVASLLLLHFLLRPTLASFAASPDLLSGGLLLAVLRLRAGHAALLGFVLGVLDAAMALENPGVYGLVLLTIAFAAARSRDLLFADARFFVAIYLFAGTWLTRTALAVLGTADPSLAGALGSGLLTAATTTVVCVGIDAVTSSSLR